MNELQAPYAAGTGLSTTGLIEEAPYVIATNAGGGQETRPKENAIPPATRQKRQKNMTAGKREMPPYAPLRLPKHIKSLLEPLFNDAKEMYIAPDSMIILITEQTSLKRDNGCWILIALPPIQTDPAPEQGIVYQIKPISLAP
jgi:hypothetical protein